MPKRVRFDTNVESNIKKFVQTLYQEAEKCQKYSPSVSSSDTKKNTKTTGKQNKQVQNNSDDNQKSKTDRPKLKKTKQIPVCRWEERAKKGIRHLLKDCKECPEQEKAELLKALVRKKENRGCQAY